VNLFDVLIACTDLTQNAEIIGNPILVLTKSKYNNVIASMDLVKVVPKISSINNFFLYALLRDDKFKQFGVNITNKSKNYSIYVDWDYCALTDLMGRSRRVTRLVPGSTLDLFQVQAFSSVAPGSTLKETVTAEDVLKRNESKDSPVALKIEVDKPLLDFDALEKAKDPEKKRLTRFKERLDPLEIYFELAFRFVGSGSMRDSDPRQLHCRLILNKLPWKAGLPWNPR
jgi:hypothetical protein